MTQCPRCHYSSQSLREGQAGGEEGYATGSETRQKGKVGGQKRVQALQKPAWQPGFPQLYIITLTPEKGQTDVHYFGTSPALTPHS